MLGGFDRGEAQMNGEGDNVGPLAGVRIVEMAAIGPVPLAGMILAGFGADIVRVERPGGGVWGDAGGAVLHRSRGTRTLDLRDEAERKSFLELIESADALVEGFRPGVMERLGVGPGKCRARNPRLVYARVTGWGQTGPLSATAGHDINYLALTGALHAIGKGGEPPTVPLNLIADYGAGAMFAALGIVSGVLAARASGKGQVIDVAMIDGVANQMSLFHALMAAGLWSDRRGDNLLDGAAPFYRCYACSDGKHVAVGALEPAFFAALLDGIGLAANEFDQFDRDGWPAMAEQLAARFAERTRDQWAERFAGSDACVTPVLSIGEAMTHPANVERGVFLNDDVPQARPAPRFEKGNRVPEPGTAISIAEALARWR